MRPFLKDYFRPHVKKKSRHYTNDVDVVWKRTNKGKHLRFKSNCIPLNTPLPLYRIIRHRPIPRLRP